MRTPPEIRFWRFVNKEYPPPLHCPEIGNCWMWTGGTIGLGYAGFNIGGDKRIVAHRFSYKMHFGEIPVGMDICHKCDNPKCVRPDHLFPGTAKDNVRDCMSKKRMKFQKSPEVFLQGVKMIRKFTDTQVFKIRRLRARHSVPCSRISKWLKVNEETIRLMTIGATYKHAPFP